MEHMLEFALDRRTGNLKCLEVLEVALISPWTETSCKLIWAQLLRHINLVAVG